MAALKTGCICIRNLLTISQSVRFTGTQYWVHYCLHFGISVTWLCCTYVLWAARFPLCLLSLRAPAFWRGHRWTIPTQIAVCILSYARGAVIWQQFDSLWEDAKFNYVWSILPASSNKILNWSQIKSNFSSRRQWPKFEVWLRAER